MVIDPHSAVGLAAARASREKGIVSEDVPIVSLACAHPAKFPDAVMSATGVSPALPSHLTDLMEREDRVSVIRNDMAEIQSFVQSEMRS